MLFYPDNAPVPAELRTGEFLLRMLRATDVALDYDAVIASRDTLLVRSSGRWPREGFTIEENLADLEGHEADHHKRTAFTYTVMTPDETLCLGCVYINPLGEMLQRLGASEGDRHRAADYEAVVSFWVRPSLYAGDLDRRLLAALRDWFRDSWAFRRVLFMANQHQSRDLRIFEDAGLQRAYAIDTSDEPHLVYLYG